MNKVNTSKSNQNQGSEPGAIKCKVEGCKTTFARYGKVIEDHINMAHRANRYEVVRSRKRTRTATPADRPHHPWRPLSERPEFSTRGAGGSGRRVGGVSFSQNSSKREGFNNGDKSSLTSKSKSKVVDSAQGGFRIECRNRFSVLDKPPVRQSQAPPVRKTSQSSGLHRDNLRQGHRAGYNRANVSKYVSVIFRPLVEPRKERKVNMIVKINQKGEKRIEEMREKSKNRPSGQKEYRREERRSTSQRHREGRERRRDRERSLLRDTRAQRSTLKDRKRARSGSSQGELDDQSKRSRLTEDANSDQIIDQEKARRRREKHKRRRQKLKERRLAKTTGTHHVVQTRRHTLNRVAQGEGGTSLEQLRTRRGTKRKPCESGLAEPGDAVSHRQPLVKTRRIGETISPIPRGKKNNKIAEAVIGEIIEEFLKTMRADSPPASADEEETNMEVEEIDSNSELVIDEEEEEEAVGEGGEESDGKGEKKDEEEEHDEEDEEEVEGIKTTSLSLSLMAQSSENLTKAKVDVKRLTKEELKAACEEAKTLVKEEGKKKKKKGGQKTEQQPVYCQICGSSFAPQNGKANLKKHLEKLHGLEVEDIGKAPILVFCEFCGETTIDYRNLRKHQYDFHQEFIDELTGDRNSVIPFNTARAHKWMYRVEAPSGEQQTDVDKWSSVLAKYRKKENEEENNVNNNPTLKSNKNPTILHKNNPPPLTGMFSLKEASYYTKEYKEHKEKQSSSTRKKGPIQTDDVEKKDESGKKKSNTSDSSTASALRGGSESTMANPNEEAVLGLEGTGSGTGEICDQREEEEEGIIKQEITEEEEVDEEELQLQQQAANIKIKTRDLDPDDPICNTSYKDKRAEMDGVAYRHLVIRDQLARNDFDIYNKLPVQEKKRWLREEKHMIVRWRRKVAGDTGDRLDESLALAMNGPFTQAMTQLYVGEDEEYEEGEPLTQGVLQVEEDEEVFMRDEDEASFHCVFTQDSDMVTPSCPTREQQQITITPPGFQALNQENPTPKSPKERVVGPTTEETRHPNGKRPREESGEEPSGSEPEKKNSSPTLEPAPKQIKTSGIAAKGKGKAGPKAKVKNPNFKQQGVSRNAKSTNTKNEGSPTLNEAANSAEGGKGAETLSTPKSTTEPRKVLYKQESGKTKSTGTGQIKPKLQVTASSSEVAKLKKQLAGKEKEITNIKKEKDKAQARHEFMLNEVKKQADGFEETIAAIQAEQEKSEREMESNKKALLKSKKDLRTSELKCKEEEGKSTELRRKVKDLEQKLKEETSKLQDVKLKLKNKLKRESEAESDELRAKMDSFKKERDTANKSVEAHRITINKLELKIKKIKDNAEKTDQEKAKLQNTCDEMAMEITNLQKSKEDEEASPTDDLRIRALEQKAESYKRSLDMERNKTLALKNQVAKSKTQAVLSDAEAEAATKALEDREEWHKEKERKLKEEIKKLTKDLKASEELGGNDQAAAEIRDNREQIGQLKKELERTRRAADNSEEQRRLVRQQVLALQGERERLMKKIDCERKGCLGKYFDEDGVEKKCHYYHGGRRDKSSSSKSGPRGDYCSYCHHCRQKEEDSKGKGRHLSNERDRRDSERRDLDRRDSDRSSRRDNFQNQNRADSNSRNQVRGRSDSRQENRGSNRTQHTSSSGKSSRTSEVGEWVDMCKYWIQRSCTRSGCRYSHPDQVPKGWQPGDPFLPAGEYEMKLDGVSIKARRRSGNQANNGSEEEDDDNVFKSPARTIRLRSITPSEEETVVVSNQKDKRVTISTGDSVRRISSDKDGRDREMRLSHRSEENTPKRKRSQPRTSKHHSSGAATDREEDENSPVDGRKEKKRRTEIETDDDEIQGNDREDVSSVVRRPRRVIRREIHNGVKEEAERMVRERMEKEERSRVNNLRSRSRSRNSKTRSRSRSAVSNRSIRSRSPSVVSQKLERSQSREREGSVSSNASSRVRRSWKNERSISKGRKEKGQRK